MPPSLTGARWSLLPLDPALPLRTDVPPAVARLLALRGIDLDGGWLAPSRAHLHDPFAMANMDAAVERLRRAARDGERLRILTDYDVDGTTSSLILQAALQVAAPGLVVDYHIPDRFTEGYGFSELAARRAAEDGVGLLVTADVGVRDHAAVEAARAGGVDVLVCDHHLPPGADVPRGAIVLCPPQASCSYPNRALAACGVSTKLAEALLADHPRHDAVLGSLIKLAAIGTIADMVSVATPENRALVALGLDALNHGRHGPGLQALLDVAGAKAGAIDEQTLGWQLAPRINAAGRLARATHVVELLTERDPSRAAALARQLDELNKERREVQAALVDRVLARIGDPPDPFVVVAGPEAEGFHRGVVGIVAARVRELVHRPVAIVSVIGDLAVGSVRSGPRVHAVRALDAVADLLVKYGGHPGAAGFTCRAADLDRVRERLGAHVLAHADDDTLVEEHVIDAEVGPDELDDELYGALRRLAPFGVGHPEPKLLLRGVRLVDVRTMGADGTHVKGRLAREGSPLEVVGWRWAEHAAALRDRPVDLVATLQASTWLGRRRLQLVLVDARPAA
jgi:single-stranded-DNA-specific exonuclease